MQHTDTQFEEELKELKESILKMGGLVEEMMSKSLKALVERNSDIAQQVIDQDRPVNQLEMDIDQKCVHMLALRQPAASDLRFIILGIRISKDLERVGDLSVDVCQQVLDLNKSPEFRAYDDLVSMSVKSQFMVKNALDAFVKNDPELANKVCEMDDEVDDLKHKVFLDMAEFMGKNPQHVQQSLYFILISRHLERIADHATNIAEEVIFMVKGQDIRHRGKV